jgi:hypothetical protein
MNTFKNMTTQLISRDSVIQVLDSHFHKEIIKEILALPSITAPSQIKEMIEKKKEIIDNMPDWEVRLEFDNLLREINTI